MKTKANPKNTREPSLTEAMRIFLEEEVEAVETGRMKPDSVAVYETGPDGKKRRVELDPEEYRQQQAAAHLATARPVAKIRHTLDMSQSQFAAWLGIPLRTVKSWEQGTAVPSGAAAKLLAIASHRPDAIEEVNELITH